MPCRLSARSWANSSGPSEGFHFIACRSLTVAAWPATVSAATASFFSAALNDAGSGWAKTMRTFMAAF